MVDAETRIKDTFIWDSKKIQNPVEETESLSRAHKREQCHVMQFADSTDREVPLKEMEKFT